MNKFIWIIIIAVLFVAGAAVYVSYDNIDDGAERQDHVLDNAMPAEPDAPVVEIGLEDEMLAVPAGNDNPPAGEDGVVVARPFKEFTVTGKNFEFSMKEIRVFKGDFVRINFTSTGGFHDWKVDEFGAATSQVNTGNSTSVDFIADTAGTFEYYCGVGEHRKFGMVGKFIVEE